MPFLILVLVWNYICSLGPSMTRHAIPAIPAMQYARNASYMAMCTLWLLEEGLVPPRLLPARYPDLWVVVNVLCCATLFCCFLAYFMVMLMALRVVSELSPRSPKVRSALPLPLRHHPVGGEEEEEGGEEEDSFGDGDLPSPLEGPAVGAPRQRIQ